MFCEDRMLQTLPVVLNLGFLEEAVPERVAHLQPRRLESPLLSGPPCPPPALLWALHSWAHSPSTFPVGLTKGRPCWKQGGEGHRSEQKPGPVSPSPFCFL